MSESAKELVGRFIDAAVKEQSSARALLRDHPEVLEGRWILDETPLHFLAVENIEEAVRFVVGLGANVNAINCFGDTALVDVAVSGNDRIAAILLEHGADPNAKSVTRNNVLDAAVESGNPRKRRSMEVVNEGGCLCGAIRYAVRDQTRSAGCGSTTVSLPTVDTRERRMMCDGGGWPANEALEPSSNATCGRPLDAWS